MGKSVWIALVLLLGVSAWIGSGFLSQSEESIAPSSGSDSGDLSLRAAASIPTVQTRLVKAEDVEQVLGLMGVTVANRSVEVDVQSKGIIAGLNVRTGASVKKNELLATIGLEDRDVRLREARAVVKLRQSEFDAALKLSKKNLQSETELTRAETNLDSARASLKSAELEIARTEIRAPFGGVIEEKFVEIGDFVDVGHAVYKIIDLSKIKIQGQVSEYDVSTVKVGMPASLTFLGGGNLEGIVTFVSKLSDSATRTFKIEVTAPNRELAIASGRTAKIGLNLGVARAHLLSPAVLTLDDQGRIGVKVVDAEDEVQFLPVELISDTPDGMWLSGLPEVVNLITMGHEFVAVGQRVISVPTSP